MERHEVESLRKKLEKDLKRIRRASVKVSVAGKFIVGTVTYKGPGKCDIRGEIKINHDSAWLPISYRINGHSPVDGENISYSFGTGDGTGDGKYTEHVGGFVLALGGYYALVSR